jgi:putative restriction endonuclease
MLNASHIVPWSKDKSNQVNPRNGLCLNVFHDRAFDRGLLTITSDFTVKVSPVIKKNAKDRFATAFLSKFDGQPIQLPERFTPTIDFIKYHNEHIYKRE